MNVFDILGPVMIGPSSSHTAGAVRLGRVALALLGDTPQKAQIQLHGSFAKTYKGHGTDKAIIAGVLGFDPDDERIRFAPQLAQERGLDVLIETAELENAHPNTARIILTGQKGETISVQGASIGGGRILVDRVNGMEVQLTGQYTSLIVQHRDEPGTIAAVTEILAGCGANICSFRLSRQKKGGIAVMTIDTDGRLGHNVNEWIQDLPNVISSTLLPPI